MIWNTWKPALTLSAVLVVSGAAGADDSDTLRTSDGAPSTTMTLGGRGTAEQAATEDNELARGYRYYGGYRGGYGYGGYRGYYSSGSYTSYRTYNVGYYRPAYYYTPRVYYPTYYQTYPVYPTYYSGCSTGVGFTLGIGGNAAPAVPLGTSLSRPIPQPMAPPAAPGDGTFRYDGGPANPVPMPKADPQTIPPAGTSASNDLPVSLKSKTSPYKYKAYGEK